MARPGFVAYLFVVQCTTAVLCRCFYIRFVLPLIDLLLVVDGEVTDFKTDPVTGLRSLTLPSGTYSIVGTENLTPEMREKYAAYLPGKAADRESFESPNTG